MLNSCRPDWWGNCSTDGVADTALSVVTMSAPFQLQTDVVTVDGAGLSCFGRNSLFAAVGSVVLCATRSLQVISSKASELCTFVRSRHPVQANAGVSLTSMAALPVPTHRAAAVNKARRMPVCVKITSAVQAAVRKFAKNAKKMDVVCANQRCGCQY
jgi:hypothetical protein